MSPSPSRQSTAAAPHAGRLGRRPPPLRQGLAGSAAALALAGLAVLAGCGGGGGSDSGTPILSAQAAAFTEGTVSGFGSIIVNGVRFDDSHATVTDDAGQAGTVKLGMRVEVQSSSVSSDGSSATASVVHFGSRVVGPVESVGTGTLTVLGQVVDVVDATVFDSSLASGLASVTVGAVIEVHGLPDASTGHLLATRIEAESGATRYKLRGTVAALDTTAKTFMIGGATVNYASASSVPATLADGSLVRVILATAKNTAGQWVATTLGAPRSSATDGQAAHVRGTITALTDTTHFTVNGLAIDASGVASLPGGLALGSEVEVAGTVSNGTLVATAVTLKADCRGKDSKRFELHGAITAIDTTAKTLTLRGVTVDYSAATYSGGTEADLAVAKRIEVQGSPDATRTQVKATVIHFE